MMGREMMQTSDESPFSLYRDPVRTRLLSSVQRQEADGVGSVTGGSVRTDHTSPHTPRQQRRNRPERSVPSLSRPGPLIPFEMGRSR